MNNPKPLIGVLVAAIESRRRALRFAWSRRTDHEAVRQAMMRCEQFVANYPGASDALVRNWCRENSAHVTRVVLGGRAGVLADLVG